MQKTVASLRADAQFFPRVKREEFDALIRQLEVDSKQSPRQYLACVAGLVALAYAYLGLILFGSLGLCLGIIALIIFLPNAATIKLGLLGIVLFGGLFLAVARGLWVRLSPPKGYPVTRAQAPQLFALLDEIRAALDCRPFHEVLLLPEHNAAVVQVPRLGLLGWHRNYLLLGLPLMQSLAPEEFKAVLAHEFAHSSRGHGRFGNWLYRVRRSWEQIFEQMMRQGSGGGKIFTVFFNWFWPLFNAHAFVLSRANEYEADACSVRLAGAEAAANALMRLPVDGNLLGEKFWPSVFARATAEPIPPDNALVAAGQWLKTGPEAPDAARWLRQAFLIETNNSDTHPCLKDRLRAIGRLPAGIERGEFPAQGPLRPAVSAAEFYLGNIAEKAAAKMSEEWSSAVTSQWAERHVQAKKLSTELAAMEQPAGAPPGPDELWLRARKLMELHGDEAAGPVAEQILQLDATHGPANFIRGRLLLAQDDERGVAFLEAAMEHDPMLTREGCNVLYGYFQRTGQRAKLRPLEERVDGFQELEIKAQQERANINPTDRFAGHDLTPVQLEAIVKILAAETEVVSAAAVRKAVACFPKIPCRVIALRVATKWYQFRDAGAGRKLAGKVVDQIVLPGQYLVFVDEGKLAALAKRVFGEPGAVIYERKEKTD